MRWGLVACALAGCSFEHGRYLADAGDDAVIDAPPSDAEIDAVPETVCRVGVTSATGTARGRVGGSGGGANFPPLACANATDRIVGVALRMSDQDTLYGGRSAHGIQIACAPVTVGSAGTAVTGTVTTYEVSGSGTMGWSPSTWTPVTQCKPGWIVSGLGAHTSEDGDLFVDATITCSQVSATGTLVAKLGLWDFNGRNRWVRTLATPGRNPVIARHADDLFCAWIATGPDGQEAVWGAWFTATDTDFVPLLLGPASKTTWNLNAIAAAGRTAVVVYDAVAATKSSELFLADVTVAGARLHQITDDDGVPSKYPDIAGTTHQALTWFDKRDGNEEVYLKVGSRTAIRDPAVTPMRVTATAGESIGAYLDWATGSGNDRIGLAWSDDAEGQHEIFFQAFAPEGRSLGAARRLTANGSASLIPAIVAAGDAFALAWNEYVPAVGDAPSTSQVSFTTVR